MFVRRSTKAIMITCLIFWVITFINCFYLPDYTVGLFVWLPIVMAICTTVIYGYKNELTNRQLWRNAFFTLLVYCIGLLVFAIEGVICIIMAAPIGLFFTWIGYLVGKQILKSRSKEFPTAMLTFLVLSVPAVMGFEHLSEDEEDIHPVVTSIEINASPEQVWQNVIVFPELDEPEEFVFKTGIAYPINAVIDGSGVGAIRNCNFSTGSFVEPITVWDEPNLLAFDVKEQPGTMKELSLYNIHPNHLHGYFISKQGQFKLTKLANGNTLLEGTTWYYNRIKPTIYWNVWSDYLIHTIHKRVLRHIKVHSEQKS